MSGTEERMASEGTRYPPGTWVEHDVRDGGVCVRCGAHWKPNLQEPIPPAGRVWERDDDWRTLRPASLALPCFPAVPAR